MSTFAVDTVIDAPVTLVWDALADIGSIYKWNPGVQASRTTSEAATGLGATRYCDLGGSNFLDEEVVLFEPEHKLTMRVTDTNLPMKAVDIRFTLEPTDAGTRVICSPVYTVKYGPLGAVLDRIYVSGTYRKGMQALLSGLKAYVEDDSAAA